MADTLVEGLRVEPTFIYAGGNKTPHSHVIEARPGMWFQFDQATQMIIIGKMWVEEPRGVGGTVGDMARAHTAAMDALIRDCRAAIKSETLAWMVYGSMEGLKIGVRERHLISAASEWFLDNKGVHVYFITF